MTDVLTRPEQLDALPVDAALISQNGTAWQKDNMGNWRPAKPNVIPYDSAGVLENAGDSEPDQWVVVCFNPVVPSRCPRILPNDLQCAMIGHTNTMNHKDTHGVYYTERDCEKFEASR